MKTNETKKHNPIHEENSKDFINNLIKNTPIISNMVSVNHIENILLKLDIVIKNNVEGDVVELGCNVGTSSIFISQMINYFASHKNYHVYDSFQGLPEKLDKDLTNNDLYIKGSCETTKDSFIHNFNNLDLKIPFIHTGWFSEIPDEEYPEKISFAFFDGDFYTSILDSFKKVYAKVQKGGIIVIHDYEYIELPGVKEACDEFLKDKVEKVIKIDGISLGFLIKE
jgi:O-methyltransferase